MISYAQSFVSFLFRTAGMQAGNIRSIYLFGSVSRGDYDEKSDVDIFVDTDKENEKETKRLAARALQHFYQSEECKKFSLLGISNPIMVKCGELRKWGLSRSVKAEGLVLYASSSASGFRKYFLVEMKPVKHVAQRNRLIRALAGRKEAVRKETGLVEKLGGQVLDSRHYLVPAEHIAPVTKIFSKENALFELREVWMQ